MEALRSAGKAIMRSPSLARNKEGTRHQKLPENLIDTKESLLEGIVFHLKYLGMTLVEKPKGEDMASAAIRRIVMMARAGTKKCQKVALTVTPRGISLQDTLTGQLMENVPIYRISYCTTDKVQNKVFAYVAQNQSNETLECHAFLSPNKKMAQAVTLTVAQAFQVALDLLLSDKGEKDQTSPQLNDHGGNPCVLDTLNSQTDFRSERFSSCSSQQQPSETFISSRPLHCGASETLLFGEDEDDDQSDDLEEPLARLAESNAQEPCATHSVTDKQDYHTASREIRGTGLPHCVW